MSTMVNTCEDFTKKYTIYMDLQDWFNMQHFYTTYDEEGNVQHDSVIRECHRYAEDENILGCTFELGYIADYEKYGLTQPV